MAMNFKKMGKKYEPSGTNDFFYGMAKPAQQFHFECLTISAMFMYKLKTSQFEECIQIRLGYFSCQLTYPYVLNKLLLY